MKHTVGHQRAWEYAMSKKELEELRKEEFIVYDLELIKSEEK